ncbi:hypothetical protein Tco_1457956 [Tanacetum coccineum]
MAFVSPLGLTPVLLGREPEPEVEAVLVFMNLFESHPLTHLVFEESELGKPEDENREVEFDLQLSDDGSLTCQRPEDRKDRNQMKDDRQQKIDRGDLTDQRIKFSDTPLEQVQNIVENNMFANERKHSEKKSAECTDERAALANLIAI